jgi:hypothetical protein
MMTIGSVKMSEKFWKKSYAFRNIYLNKLLLLLFFFDVVVVVNS